MPLATFSSVADSLAKFAWPLLAAIVLGLLWPEVKRVLRSRAFTIKVGSFELTAQDASDQLARQIKDLQTRLEVLEAPPASESGVEGGPETGEAPERRVRQTAGVGSPIAEGRRRILWVDDNPAGNAYEIDALRTRGWEVEVSSGTVDALERLDRSSPFAVLITDLGRREDGRYDKDAGLKLTAAVRERVPSLLVFVYTSLDASKRRADELRQAGAAVITASPSALLSAVASAPVVALERVVGAILRESDRFALATERRRSGPRQWDFTGAFEGRRVAVEVRLYTENFMRRVRDDRVAFGADSGQYDELWVVTDRLPPELRRLDHPRLMTVDELRGEVGLPSPSGTA